MAWDDEAFKARVKARCRELGKSVRSVLLEGGLDPAYLQKTSVQGRAIETLEKLCVPLQWSLKQILGLPPVHAEVSLELMTKAGKIVRRALRQVPTTDDDEFYALTIAYNALLDHQRNGGQIDDANAIGMLEATIAAHFGFARPPR
jgi:hypothetical protein